MNKSSGHNSPKSSRLLRCLDELEVLAGRPRENQFGSRLGRLIDLSDSIALADTLRQVSRKEEVDSEMVADKRGELLKADFLELRTSMVAFIARSFVVTADTEQSPPFSLPRLSGQINSDDGYKPYQRFYALHQSEMESQINRLRVAAREQVVGSSAKLARVVTLDTALFETLQSYCRKQLTQISVLLAQRFYLLRDTALAREDQQELKLNPEACLAPEGWLSLFYREMQNTLLAELDLRLQPLLGLVEACEYEELNQR